MKVRTHLFVPISPSNFIFKRHIVFNEKQQHPLLAFPSPKKLQTPKETAHQCFELPLLCKSVLALLASSQNWSWLFFFKADFASFKHKSLIQHYPASKSNHEWKQFLDTDFSSVHAVSNYAQETLAGCPDKICWDANLGGRHKMQTCTHPIKPSSVHSRPANQKNLFNF